LLDILLFADSVGKHRLIARAHINIPDYSAYLHFNLHPDCDVRLGYASKRISRPQRAVKAEDNSKSRNINR
jgi:hypothetical protein